MVVTDRLHIEKRPGYFLVLDPAAPNWIATDADGAWLARQLHAGRTHDEVAYRFSKRAGISLRRALEMTGSFAGEIGNIIPSAHRPKYEGRHRYLRPHRLREVWLHVSDRCNLACRHCLVSSGPNGREGMDTEALLDTVRQARDLGADTFYFTGGEPLLREDLPHVLREITENYKATAVVLTNGTLLWGELLDRLGALPRDRLFLQVSLDGSTAARNDSLRSAGSFEGAVRGIKAARGAGIDVTVATVVLRENLADLRAIADLVHSLGVTHLHLMWQHMRERGGRLPRAGVRRLLQTVSDVRRQAGSIDLVIDNFENARRTVNGDPGIKYDLSNACWDSLAIYRDGGVYPSACLVGIPSEAAGCVLETPLERVWLESERFASCRARSVIDSGIHEGDPWIFLHGGGDPEQAYFAGDGNGRAAIDPYLPLHKAIARELIDETVADRCRLLGDCVSGPVVYQTMGDDGYGCPIEAGVLNGGPHQVDFVHSNCVLIQDVIAKSRAQIRQYYGEAAREPKTEICQPINLDPRDLAHIPNEVIARSYGCGSPVFAADPKPGEIILDLGSGAGLEAFIAARFVEAGGRVIGVDMTPDMLGFANEASRAVADKLGYTNVSFAQGFLESLPIKEASVDAIISNCVINLSPEKLKVFAEIRRVLKPGGRIVISDLVSEAPLPPEIRFNPRLKGECIAGAMTEEKLLSTLQKLGFVGLEILDKRPWRTVDEIGFNTVTVRAYKPTPSSRVLYHYPGPFRSVTLDSGDELVRGGATEIDAVLLPGNGNGHSTGPGVAPSSEQHLQDCLVCGAPLLYLDDELALKCYYCGEQKTANARCEEGHFVCDACHARDHVGFIRTYCRNTKETDAIAIFSEMRASHLFPLHGPEHHALVPAAFLTAYRNQFGGPLQGRIEAAIERGAKLPGGTCAYWGGCAAALGIGISFAAILRATPLSHEERGIVQTVVSDILARLGQFASPRCCRRESYLSLQMGCELS
ncbi:MAG: methyltransferase domain-containing protein, partial [Armatimonadetes bacterium]|nr:methyltransferase domain-containing protein [Armatimonadota bacterium]